MDKQPTEAQRKEFWEWCGFTHKFGGEWWYDRYKFTNSWWEAPNGRKYKDLPPIDLNNLKEYTTPKLKGQGWMWRVQYSPLRDNDTGKQISDWTGYASIYYVLNDKPLFSKRDYYAINPDPALALFWAIWEIIHDTKGQDNDHKD